MFSNYFRFAIFLLSFVLSVVCYLYVSEHSWMMYPAVLFSLMFVFQLFTIVSNSKLDNSLKKDVYVLAGLLLVVVVSNILWVFVFQWFKHIAIISSFVFLYVLFIRLKGVKIRNELN